MQKSMKKFSSWKSLSPEINQMKNKYILSAVIILILLFADQALKLWIKSSMYLGQEIRITSWFYIHFTENPGMAFGMILPGAYGKLILSVFRLIAVGTGFYFLWRIIQNKAHSGFVAASALILGGALGNLIDGTFYGRMFSDSFGKVAEWFPADGGYAGWFGGYVVDMLWFPLIRGFWPAWVPLLGGDYFEFFRPVFNIADAGITVGVAIIIVFQGIFFAEKSISAHLDPPAQNSVKD